MADALYDENAEWYAALVEPGIVVAHAAVKQLLGGVAGGAIVEFAAGVGRCLPTLRDLGADRLVAVEPSMAMRVGLMTTVASDPDLLARTTIVPATLADAVERLPVAWSGAVMLNAIGHLDDAERALLWRLASARLATDARLVVSLQPPERPVAMPWTDFGAVAVGEHVLRTRGRAEPAGELAVEWTMEWTLLDAAGVTLDQRTGTSSWRTLSLADLDREAEKAGLERCGGVEEAATYAFSRR